LHSVLGNPADLPGWRRHHRRAGTGCAPRNVTVVPPPTTESAHFGEGLSPRASAASAAVPGWPHPTSVAHHRAGITLPA
jgi:hypothetical protein